MTQTIASISESPAVDREFCDRCTARAKVVVALFGGGQLAFCGHHAHQHAEPLHRIATEVQVSAGFSWPAATTGR